MSYNDFSEGQIVHGKRDSYQIERTLSQRNNANVYTAVSLNQGLEVVLKKQAPSSISKGLEREAAVQILIQRHGGHQNILSPYELIKDEKAAVFHYIKGGNLAEFQRRKGKFTPQLAIAVLSPLCDAVDYLHSLGIVHRDIKRDNVLLKLTRVADEEKAETPLIVTPKLYDFDLGWHECISGYDLEGCVYGTPTAMAPEVCRGGKTEPRQDIYALGVLLYELLANHSPFEAETVRGTMWNQFHKAAPSITNFNDQVTPGFEYVLQKTLAKKPDQRYQ